MTEETNHSNRDQLSREFYNSVESSAPAVFLSENTAAAVRPVIFNISPDRLRAVTSEQNAVARCAP